MTFKGRHSVSIWAALLTGGLCLTTAGCGSSAPTMKLVPVSGKAAVDGKPLPEGSVSFRPDGSKGNKSLHQPSGPINAEGNYELNMPPDRKGAPPGWYKVVVISYDKPRPGNLKSFISSKYADERTTPLSVEVIENPEPNRYDLKLTKQ